jgi:hypothetical protein
VADSPLRRVGKSASYSGLRASQAALEAILVFADTTAPFLDRPDLGLVKVGGTGAPNVIRDAPGSWSVAKLTSLLRATLLQASHADQSNSHEASIDRALAARASLGCGWQHGAHKLHPNKLTPQAALAQNPMYVPLSDREFLWNQLIDTLDNYFRIEREERVRLVGGVLTEGQVDTLPQPGASLLEPWRRDSVPGFERRYATLQSIRRRAVVRVKPQVDGGYLVDVAVYKELEDLSQPEYSTVNLEALRHDGTLVRPSKEMQIGPATLGWIPVGRDMALEQRILTELRGRLGVVING